jgi:hypothetical protein
MDVQECTCPVWPLAPVGRMKRHSEGQRTQVYHMAWQPWEVSVNGAGAVCDQKTSKFFVSHQEESMAGHVGVKGGGGY